MALAFDIGALIDSDPEYYGGRPFVRGKRVTVQRVAIVLGEGRTPEQIAADLHLTVAEVHAALSYYYANRDEIEADIRAQDAEYDRLASIHRSLATDRRV